MRLRIQLLRQGAAVKDLLQRDGWKLQAESVDTLSAYHPAVDGEPAARRRLHGLGLLTSAILRIEFPLLERSCTGPDESGEWPATIEPTAQGNCEPQHADGHHDVRLPAHRVLEVPG